MLRPGDKIEYLDDVSSPLNQKGIRGQMKIIDRDIPMWTAKFLLRGGKIRPYDPASPLQLEEEKPKKIKKGPAEIPKPESLAANHLEFVAGTKVKPERRTNSNGRKGKSNSEADQGRDHGIKSSKGKTPDRGG